MTEFADPDATNPSSPSAKDSAIESLDATALLGEFDYTLTRSHSGSGSNLLILYGDNGTGKTTLLRLMFHALSASNNRGHRHALLDIPFRSCSITLRSGARLHLARDNAKLVGAYGITVTKNNATLVDGHFRRDGEGRHSFDSDQTERSFIGFLESLGTKFYFLNSDRDLLSDEVAAEAARDDQTHVYRRIPEPHRQSPAQSRSEINRRYLAETLDLCRGWIRQQAFTAVNRGAQSSHNVYEQLLYALAHPAPFGSTEQLPDRNSLALELNSLASDIERYSALDFVPALSVERMVDSVKQAPNGAMDAIARLVRSYVQGSRARLDALRPTFDKTTQLIELLNDFYAYTRVTFSLRHGFSFFSSSGFEVSPSQLSSGEQQILSLFCITLISNSEPSTFLIDEPELSLNIKWQRRLLGSIVRLSGDAQFIVASHAIELITEHSAEVVRLEPQLSLPVAAQQLVEDTTDGKDRTS